MPVYKTIPVDLETYNMLLAICDVHERGQGAQVKVWVKAEYEKLDKAKLLPKGKREPAKVDKEVQT